MTESASIQHLLARGWAPAEPILAPRVAEAYARLGLSLQERVTRVRDWSQGRTPDFARRPWFKSLHALSPEFFDLGTHPRIVSQIRQVLGEDILLWGCALIERFPGQIHSWHVDLEHATWPGVSVFVALKNVQPGLSSLKFIGGSHLLHSEPGPRAGDEQVIAQAKASNADCTLDYPPISDGEFMLFGGRTWHGSDNRAGVLRCAAILHYTVPSSKVAIPLGFDPPRWSDYAPPCVLASGRDTHGVNRLIARPSASARGSDRARPSVLPQGT
jgi:hypothetical protein